MGLQPTGTRITPVGTHYDAQGNLVDDATGQIIRTAIGPQGGDYGTPDSPTDFATAAHIDPNSTLGKLINDNPITAAGKGSYDLATGHPLDALGDVVSGTTLGQLGSASQISGGLGQVPNALGLLGDRVKGAAGDLVSGITDAAAPATADTSGLTDVQNRAFNQQDYLNQLRNQLAGNPTQAPSADLVQLDQTSIDPLRARQGVALDQLQAAAEGRTPSAAEILAKDQINRAASQAYGNAAALQGGNSSGGTLRQALDAQQQLVGSALPQILADRAKEQSDARQQLVTGVQGATAGETNISNDNATLNNARNVANVTAATTTHGQDVSQQGDLVSGANQALGSGVSAASAKANADAQVAASKNAYKGALIGGAAGGLGHIFSDRTLKKDVRGAEGDLVQLAEAAPGYTFEYKDAAIGPGRRVGVMAQDVARSRMGKDMVHVDDDGDLVLDGANSVGAALAMSAKALRDTQALKRRRG